jgi:FlaA1/EpsC-like NDP-sugar epimerase
MTIPEAVRLVLQAAVFSETTGIFVLDMGNPIEIYELARTMISLSGNVPNVDIPIEFTALASAEKLTEELQDDGEDVGNTRHARVMLIRKQEGYASNGFLMKVVQWRSLVRQGDFVNLLDQVKAAHPDFRRKEKARAAAAGTRVSA